MPITVRLTRRHVEDAIRLRKYKNGGLKMNEQCPLAQALQERFPFSYISVGAEFILIDRELFPLSEDALEIVKLCSAEWSTLTPRVITLT